MNLTKKISSLIVIIVAIHSSYSQTYNTGLFFTENVQLKNIADSNANVNGTPYSDETFQPANIEPLNKLFFVRYNAAADQIEVNLDENGILILDKKAEDYKITFNKDEKKFIILNDPNYGLSYYILLDEFSNLVLYSKETKTFHPKQEAMSSYQSDKPAHYSDLNVSYFYKLKKDNSELVELSLKKNSFYKAFPKQKNKLKSFFKDNDIDLDNEADLIKVFEFLNNNL